jgi:hypothetical protein
MSIIINDFEIVLDPPQTTSQPQQSASETPSSQPTSRLAPEDIERIVRHFEQRRCRVRAD